MGLLSPKDRASCLVASNLLGSFFSGWVLRLVYQTAVTQNKKSKAIGTRIETEEVLCPCVCKRFFSTLQFTMWSTVATVASFFFAFVTLYLASVVFLAVCPKCQKDDSQPAMAAALTGVGAIGLVVGYLLMFVTHFERLRLTFSGTSMQLPKTAPNVLYAVLSLFTLLVAGFYVLQYIDYIASAVCLSLLIFTYFAGVSALARAFYYKTLAIAANTHGIAAKAIVNTAIRITVVVSMSLFSTTISVILWVVFLVVCPNCLIWRLLGALVLTVDMSLNAFCLMCTFRRAENYYKRVFGRVDVWMQQRVTSGRQVHVEVMNSANGSNEQGTKASATPATDKSST